MTISYEKKQRIENLIEDVKYHAVVGGIVTVVTAAASTIPVLFGVGLGALADHTPYFKDAIPQGIGYIVDSVMMRQTGIADILSGHITEIGASLGFIMSLKALPMYAIQTMNHLYNSSTEKIKFNSQCEESKKIDAQVKLKELEWRIIKEQGERLDSQINAERIRVRNEVQNKKSNDT